MKSLKNRLLLIFMVWIGALLAGLFGMIGQLFPVYAEAPAGRAENLWAILGLFFVVALILSYIFGMRLIYLFTQPIENAVETALELAKGNFQARAAESGTGRIFQLSTSINVLARSLQEISAVREIEQERLKTIIENMGSGLLMIGRQGHVSLVNRPFAEEFNLNPEKINRQFYRDIDLPDDLLHFIDEVFMTETAASAQLMLPKSIQVKHMAVYGAPVIGNHERWLGIVIVLNDITELKRLEQIRKDFVANVSHELRTPVTSIKGFSETLLEGAHEDTSSLLAFLEIIYKESNRLELLIHDLLELSKIEQHGFHLNISQTDMAKVLERAIEMTRPAMEEKQIDIEYEVTGNAVIEGDANRLVQIMMNLLGNAAVYSPENTKVRASVTEGSDHVVVTISDQGIGIGKQEIPRIFERFYRVDRARSRNSGGTGLGLAIVKHLTEAHHGKIQVESTVGEGTSFHITLPKKQPDDSQT